MKNKVYISIGNQEKPDEIIINGKKFEVTGVTHFSLELRPMKPPKFIIAYGASIEKSDIDFQEEGTP